jgi:hypothetical protein
VARTNGRKQEKGKEGSGDEWLSSIILARGRGGRPEKGHHATSEEGGSLVKVAYRGVNRQSNMKLT